MSKQNTNHEHQWMSNHLFDEESKEEWTIDNPWSPQYKSQLGQDKFVDTALSSRRNGYFIDIGAAHPVVINNTHFLEKQLSWDGLSIDMGPEKESFAKTLGGKEAYMEMWEKERSTPLLCEDALEIDYKKLFKERGVPKHVEYLTIDLEPADITFECLLKIPFDEYEFSVVTFEHDFYRNPEEHIKIVHESRRYMSQYGYAAVNFSCLDTPWPLAGFDINKIVVQEDWYINTKYLKFKGNFS